MSLCGDILLMYRPLQRPEDGMDPLELVLTDICEQTNVGVRNQTHIPWKATCSSQLIISPSPLKILVWSLVFVCLFLFYIYLHIVSL